ncbi:MAG: Hsp20/alpha crystallin family protein [Candidatus Lokiarchaeota archaeon]|nr:Hsp20/alpha crystallin family protein [Candidatus Lokiarchaeota archaeon]
MLIDEFDEFIDKIKKHFKLDSDMFEIDFIFLPESEIKKGRIPDKEKLKGIKISYHFENGMDKPEIKIEGNIESKKVLDYLKDADLSKLPNVRDLYDSQSTKEIDASVLSLESYEKVREDADLLLLEPYSEVCNNESFTEILFEVPGIDKEEVKISFREKGKKLVFRAENESRKYMTSVALPFPSSVENCELDVNNGVAIIKLSNST